MLSKRANYRLHRLISLAPDAGEFFKIFYRGPQDDKERYYRVQFTEMPITLFPERNRGKRAKRYQLSHWKPFWLFGHENEFALYAG